MRRLLRKPKPSRPRSRPTAPTPPRPTAPPPPTTPPPPPRTPPARPTPPPTPPPPTPSPPPTPPPRSPLTRTRSRLAQSRSPYDLPPPFLRRGGRRRDLGREARRGHRCPADLVRCPSLTRPHARRDRHVAVGRV